MWPSKSNPSFTDPDTMQTVPSRHGMAKQAYLDKQRAHANATGNAGLRFRWARRLGFPS